ncbi:MAG: magnesium transporter [Bacillota bacterium]|nr:magnesium transporter [Bacillota bacterium]
MEYEFEKQFEETVEAILALLREKKYVQARKEILANNEVDIAEILEEVREELGVEIAIIMLRALPKDVSVEVFSNLPSDDQLAIISGITDKEIRFIINEMDFDDMIDVLEELPANLVDKILDKTPKEERKLINTFLNYPENSAGSLMTPDYISLQKDMTVAQAMAHIKAQGMDSETVYTCYVKDRGRKLIGIVSLRSLVVAEDDVAVESLMHTEDMISVNVLDDQEAVSNLFKRYGFLALPVVDREERLVGIITVDDILDIIEEETTEDMQRMAGVMTADAEEYLDTSVWKHLKSRLPWLLFLMVSLMVTGVIIVQFESLLSQVIVLVAYLPLLMGTGGNSGSQSATLVIRGLALADIDLKDCGKVLWKELRIGFFAGLILSLLNGAKMLWLDGESLMVALTVCGSLLLIIMLAKCLGGMLPLLAKKLKIDPALMASPMIASLNDMITVVIYFAMATLILGI